MSSVVITCPSCGFYKEVISDNIPTNVINITCPKCKKVFDFNNQKDSDDFQFYSNTNPCDPPENNQKKCPFCKKAITEYELTCSACKLTLNNGAMADRKSLISNINKNDDQETYSPNKVINTSKKLKAKYCRHCHALLSYDDIKCIYCGKATMSAQYKKAALLFGAISFFIFILSLMSNNESSNSKIVNDKETKTKKNDPVITDTQNEFISKIEYFNTEYNNALNEIKKSEVFNAARSYDKEFFNKNGNKINNWGGYLSKLITNKGGSSLNINIIVKSRNINIYFYDGYGIFNDIVPSSNIYKQASELKEDDCIVFSGEVNPSEGSRSERFAMSAPEYNIHLTNLTKCQAPYTTSNTNVTPSNNINTSTSDINSNSRNESEDKAPKFAFLQVSSNPTGAQVIIDGIQNGITPIIVKLNLGQHKIFLSIHGYKNIEQQIDIDKSGEYPIHIEFIND
jgi:RNA polymerase subunit RPABC4/transcription elongation factor Spt4